MIQVMTVLTDKLEVDQLMQPCLLKNSSRSIVLLLQRVGVKPKKEIVLIDWLYVYNGRGPIFISGT